jgi:hypothetical protein
VFVLSQRNLPKDFNLICPVPLKKFDFAIGQISGMNLAVSPDKRDRHEGADDQRGSRARRTRAWRAAEPAVRNGLLHGLRQNVFCRNRHQHVPAFARDNDGIPGAAGGELDVVSDELACRRQRRRVRLVQAGKILTFIVFGDLLPR